MLKSKLRERNLFKRIVQRDPPARGERDNSPLGTNNGARTPGKGGRPLPPFPQNPLQPLPPFFSHLLTTRIGFEFLGICAGVGGCAFRFFLSALAFLAIRSSHVLRSPSISTGGRFACIQATRFTFRTGRPIRFSSHLDNLFHMAFSPFLSGMRRFSVLVVLEFSP